MRFDLSRSLATCTAYVGETAALVGRAPSAGTEELLSAFWREQRSFYAALEREFLPPLERRDMVALMASLEALLLAVREVCAVPLGHTLAPALGVLRRATEALLACYPAVAAGRGARMTLLTATEGAEALLLTGASASVRELSARASLSAWRAALLETRRVLLCAHLCGQ